MATHIGNHVTATDGARLVVSVGQRASGRGEATAATTPDKQDIAARFALRSQAERYRDRFSRGRHRATHRREVAALHTLLSTLGHLDTILDVASGAGRFAPVFVQHARATLQTDFSLPMLLVSRESYDLPQIPGHVRADARALPFAPDSVDLVFCHRLLNHLPREEDRLQIMRCMAMVSRRFVTVSCLTPPAVLRTVRRLYAKLRSRRPIDGFVEADDLLRNAEQAGLRLIGRTPIRAGFRSAAFFTFTKASAS